MKKQFIFFVLVWLTLNTFSQDYIDKDKDKVRKKFNQYNNTFKAGGAKILETDSSINFILRDSLWQPLDIQVYFDETGDSYKEIYTFQCDSCCQKYFERLLKKPFYQWIKISDGIYITQTPRKYIVFQNPDQRFSCVLQKLEIDRKEFLRLKKKSEKKAN